MTEEISGSPAQNKVEEDLLVNGDSAYRSFMVRFLDGTHRFAVFRDAEISLRPRLQCSPHNSVALLTTALHRHVLSGASR